MSRRGLARAALFSSAAAFPTGCLDSKEATVEAQVAPQNLHLSPDDYRKVSSHALRESFLAAAAIGYLCKHNATLSAEEGGCQAEIGVGSAMAAAMAGEALGAGVHVIANAAESALEHHLGMTCDPMAGFVQVPYIERCAFGAVKARTAYCISSNEVEMKLKVDLDTCIAGMAMIAKDMNPKYKETSEAGLAALVLC